MTASKSSSEKVVEPIDDLRRFAFPAPQFTILGLKNDLQTVLNPFPPLFHSSEFSRRVSCGWPCRATKPVTLSALRVCLPALRPTSISVTLANVSLGAVPKLLVLQFQVAGAQTGVQGVLARSRPFEVRGES